MDDNREQLLQSFQDLRVTDVVDAMDALGFFERGQVSQDIRPLWRDIDTFKHRIYGIAHTVRFVPTDKPIPRLEGSYEEYDSWLADWRRTLVAGPKKADIRPGDVIIIDGNETGTVGYIGSSNSLGWMAAGAVGAITNGGCRDTDELIKQKVPVYSRYICKTVKPGRLELDAVQVNVNIGGAVVRPGDVVVADGDGVVCVPRQIAPKVAEFARRIAAQDKSDRRKRYQELGMEEDVTVQL